MAVTKAEQFTRYLHEQLSFLVITSPHEHLFVFSKQYQAPGRWGLSSNAGTDVLLKEKTVSELTKEYDDKGGYTKSILGAAHLLFLYED